MKAKELIEILATDPEADVQIGYEELVMYSELTSGTEDRIEDIEAVMKEDGKFIVSIEAYLHGEKLWPITTAQ